MGPHKRESSGNADGPLAEASVDRVSVVGAPLSFGFSWLAGRLCASFFWSSGSVDAIAVGEGSSDFRQAEQRVVAARQSATVGKFLSPDIFQVEPIAGAKATRHDGQMLWTNGRSRHPLAIHLLLFGIASTGCVQTRAPSSARGDTLGGSGRDDGASPSTAASSSTTGSSSEDLRGSVDWLEDGRKGDPSRALPRLSFRHLGMHIGGGPNDAESKRPWLRAIEAGSIELLSCYVHVQQPEQGGSYGVDLYVGKAGGAPEVRDSRQKLGDEQFDNCMRAAFTSLQFLASEQPTVLSYSLLFEMPAG